MKVKHIITTCGIILGGMAVANGGASAIVTYRDSTDVQFTFSSTLSMTLDGDGFVISGLTPGNTGKSNAVTASVSTNNPAGYILSATVGNSTYTTTDLVSTDGQRFAMMGTGSVALSSGTWGYTVNDGYSYGALSAATPTVLDQTTTAGNGSTVVKIGAYASPDQKPGTYNNVVNFAVVSNVATRKIEVASGSGVASVTPFGESSYAEGDEIDLTATCSSGYTFSNWAKSADFGTFDDVNSANATYTVGAGNAILTAYCVSSS